MKDSFFTAFIRLFEICFKRSISMDFLKWRYSRDGKFLAYSAASYETNGDMIGHTAMQLLPFSIDQKIMTGALTMSSMVDPATGGKFPILLKEIHETCSDKTDFFYGFPNDNSVTFFKAIFKWQDKGPINHLQKIPVKDMAFQSNIVSFSVNQLIEHSEKITDLTRAFAENYRVTSSRTVDYLQWRYFESPRAYEFFVLKEDEVILGYIVVSLFEDGKNYIGDIVDLVFRDNDSLTILLKFSEQYFYGLSVGKIDIWSSHLDLQGTLIDLGYALSGKASSFLTAKNNKESDQMALLDDRNNWYICKGDSDVY
jgi:hypothetical protein